MSAPKITQNPMYQLLRHEKVQEFNDRRAAGEKVDLAYCDFRSLDLRGLNAKGLDLTGAYFRGADLRGVDFSETMLDGVSIATAKISGVKFPLEIPAQEIMLSLQFGTRMRYYPVCSCSPGQTPKKATTNAQAPTGQKPPVQKK